jgi:hypothetical protein
MADPRAIIKQRLGLINIAKEENPDDLLPVKATVAGTVCDGDNCTGCFEYIPTGAGDCQTCKCKMICHVQCADNEDLDDCDEDYESLYGGGEDW